MFKKSNRNFRLKKAESDDEPDEEEKRALEESKVTNLEKLKTKVLSFKDDMPVDPADEDGSNDTGGGGGDEDEDVGEFKVKKSRESRRIVKEMKKQRREKERQQQQRQEQQESKDFNVAAPPTVLFNKKAQQSATTKLVAKKERGKYLVNKYESAAGADDDDDDRDDHAKSGSGNGHGRNDGDQAMSDEDEEDHEEKLRRLRQEIAIMNGDDENDHDDLAHIVENERDEEKRSMKLMIKSGIIPDASMIHAARKKREMARQEGDFIPLASRRAGENTIKYKSNDKSRFIREDDEADLSDFEDAGRNGGVGGGSAKHDSRLSMNFRARENLERQTIRDNFLAYEQGSDEEKGSDDNTNGNANNRDHSEDDDDEEEDEWEKEQLRKVLSTNVDLRKSGKAGAEALRALATSTVDHESRKSTVKAYNQMQTSGVSKKELIKKSLAMLEESIRSREAEHHTNEERQKASELDFENLKIAKPVLDKQYVYFQEIKAFIRDFIDCYNEKIVEIDKCEAKLLALFKQRADKLTSRRQEDIRDQTNECSMSKPIDPAHQRRMNDREARRAKRKELREEKARKSGTGDDQLSRLQNNEGLSSDDDESPTDVNMFRQKKDDIIKQFAESVTDDVADDFIDVSLVLERFQRWRTLSPSTYSNAYVALSLPKLLSPLVRIDLIDWMPLASTSSLDGIVNNNPDNYLATRKWFAELIDFARDLAHDDLLIIPHIVEKTVLVKLISLADSVYDPFSSTQTRNFASIVTKLAHELPTLNSQSVNTKKLAEAVYNRFKQSIGQDVFVPLYSRQIIEQKSTEKSKFFYRQFWSCVKLYSNVLEWKSLLSDAALKELALDCLFNRYLMISLQNLPLNLKTISVLEFIVDKLPAEWLLATNLPQLASITRLARKIVDSIHDDELKTNKIDATRFKEQMRRVKGLLTKIGAADQALALTNAYEFI